VDLLPGGGRPPAVAGYELEDLEGIERRALPQIITDHPQNKTARV
jgi:hypothetical protein